MIRATKKLKQCVQAREDLTRDLGRPPTLAEWAGKGKFREGGDIWRGIRGRSEKKRESTVFLPSHPPSLPCPRRFPHGGGRLRYRH